MSQYQPLKIEDVIDLKLNEVKAITHKGVIDLILKLETITAPTHDCVSHRFEDTPEKNGVCKHCGWVHPDVPTQCEQGHMLVEHLSIILESLRNVRDFIEGKETNVIKIPVVFLGKAPDFWPFFNI